MNENLSCPDCKSNKFMILSIAPDATNLPSGLCRWTAKEEGKKRQRSEGRERKRGERYMYTV